MSYIIAEISTIALFVGFIALTQYESNRKVRFFESTRLKLDRVVARGIFVWTHVALTAFIRDFAKDMFMRVAHDSTSMALRVTQFIERQLTRAVYELRSHFTHNSPQAPKSTSPFVIAITDFKHELRKENQAKRKEIE